MSRSTLTVYEVNKSSLANLTAALVHSLSEFSKTIIAVFNYYSLEINDRKQDILLNITSLSKFLLEHVQL